MSKKAIPIKTCTFCGNTGLTKEHIFPDWAGDLIGKNGNSYRFETDATIDPQSRMPVILRRHRRPGLPQTKKLRVVCNTCNNTWMSNVESRTKAIITKLIVGEKLALNEYNCRTLAEWVFLKVLVIEASRPAKARLTPMQRRYEFREKNRILDRATIWLGVCGDGSWTCRAHGASAQIGPRYTASSPGPADNIQNISLGMGQAFIHTFRCAESSFDFSKDLVAPENAMQIWPFVGECDWPSLKRLTSAEADAIAGMLERAVQDKSIPWDL